MRSHHLEVWMTSSVAPQNCLQTWITDPPQNIYVAYCSQTVVFIGLPAVQSITFLLCNMQMPGVTVKDVNQQEFVRALAAFLKK